MRPNPSESDPPPNPSESRTVIPAEKCIRVYKNAPGFRPDRRERETRFRVYKEAPGFRLHLPPFRCEVV